MDEKKLKKLEELLKLVDESISREEFVNSFENILKQIISLEEKLVKKIDVKLDDTQNEVATALKSLEPLKERFEQAIKDAQEANDTTFAGVRQRAIESIDGLFNKMRLKEKFNVIIDEYAGKIDKLNSKIQEINPDKIIKEVLNKIPLQKTDTAEEERDRLESLKEGEKLSIQAIQDLSKILEELKNRPMGKGGPGLISVRTRFIDDATPTGTINGINTIFTLTKAPETGSLKVYRGGARQRITEDYTLSGRTITFLIAPVVGEIILCDYRY